MTDLAVIHEPSADIVGGIFEAYRREGFDAGCEHARHELLASIVLCAEDFLREQKAPAHELRKALYAFVDHLERELGRESGARGYVEGGLGI